MLLQFPVSGKDRRWLISNILLIKNSEKSPVVQLNSRRIAQISVVCFGKCNLILHVPRFPFIVTDACTFAIGRPSVSIYHQ